LLVYSAHVHADLFGQKVLIGARPLGVRQSLEFSMIQVFCHAMAADMVK